MNFEQDYIMRCIHEMVRFILKMLFNIDDINQCEEKTQMKMREHSKLMSMASEGKINEAENYLYDCIDSNDKNWLIIGIRFYNLLNEFDDIFLEKHDYSRQEVHDGLIRLLSSYGHESLLSVLTQLAM